MRLMAASTPAPPETSAAPTARRVLQDVPVFAPLSWLRAGWRDMARAPVVAGFYGACFWSMAALLGAVFRLAPEYTLSFVSGCFLVGPFLAMGLYDASQRLEQGERASLSYSLTCWENHLGSMSMLVLVMLLLELLWGRASLVVFAVFFDTGMPSTASVLQAVFNPRNWEFLAVYTGVFAVFGGLVFGTCALSIPMILDRDTDAITAGLASLQAVAGRPAPMLLWAGLIVALVVVAFAFIPFGVGIVLLGPWLGHATWHAYRGCFRWEGAAVAPSRGASA